VGRLRAQVSSIGSSITANSRILWAISPTRQVGHFRAQRLSPRSHFKDNRPTHQRSEGVVTGGWAIKVDVQLGASYLMFLREVKVVVQGFIKPSLR
jgi:hypothetical protein